MITFLNLGNVVYSGRLGNQLFQIASTIGIGFNNKIKVNLPPWRYSKYFPNYSKYSFDMTLNADFSYNNLAYSGTTYKDFIISDNYNWNVSGYFQSEKYFENCIPSIKNIFASNIEVSNCLEDCVAVHVRLGDYLDKKNYHTCLLETDYYKKAISMFPRDTKFAIFSDDIMYCKKIFDGNNFTYVINNEVDLFDMIFMSTCKGHIIANSTFSWWGAWLGEKNGGKVIAPINWFSNGMDSTDIVPERWLCI